MYIDLDIYKNAPIIEPANKEFSFPLGGESEFPLRRDEWKSFEIMEQKKMMKMEFTKKK